MKQKGPAYRQAGFAHIFLILFLLAGLTVAVYLVQNKTNILPKADEPKIVCNEVPDMPSGLNGDCARGSGTAELFWKGSTACYLITSYYVRYIKPDGTWWPAVPGENDQSVTRIGYKSIEVGVGKSIKAWGVYACNINGCSDFASSGVVSCGDTSVVPN